MSNPMRLVAAIAIAVVAGVAAFNLFDNRPASAASPARHPRWRRRLPAPTLSSTISQPD